jgi:catalase (peroxidase I)
VAGHAHRLDLRLEFAAARDSRSLCGARHETKFVRDFIKAWVKVMNADRFDITTKPVTSNQAT